MPVLEGGMNPLGNTCLDRNRNNRRDRRIEGFSLAIHLRKVQQFAFFDVSLSPALGWTTGRCSGLQFFSLGAFVTMQLIAVETSFFNFVRKTDRCRFISRGREAKAMLAGMVALPLHGRWWSSILLERQIVVTSLHMEVRRRPCLQVWWLFLFLVVGEVPVCTWFIWPLEPSRGLRLELGGPQALSWTSAWTSGCINFH